MLAGKMRAGQAQRVAQEVAEAGARLDIARDFDVLWSREPKGRS